MKHIRSALASAVIGGAAAFSVAACSGAGTPAVTPSPAAQQAPAAPVVVTPAANSSNAHAAPAAAPKPTKHAAPTSTTTWTKATATSTPKHRAKPKSATSNGPGCGQRAVTAGVFNPTCSEFQGYLDPGLSAGRAPNNADIQSAWMNCTAVKSVEECRREQN